MTAPVPLGDFDNAHLYCQWGGKLPGGEQWSNGLRFASVNGNVVSPNDQAGMIAGVKTAIQAWHVRAGSMISTEALLSFVKLNAISVDGGYSIDTTTSVAVADVPGANAAWIYPNQVALAVTLETGFSRGPAHRGRFFSPMPSIGVAADGMISVVDATSVKTSFATLLTALNAVNANYKVAVFSRNRTAPAHRLVTSASIGRVLDTQRRRRRSLVENYV